MLRMRLALSISLLPALAAPLPSAFAQGQKFPERPLRLIVPYAPGGAVDLVGRTFAQYLPEFIGQPVVVENRPGAGAMIGVEAVARGLNDGYTLLVVDPSVVINPTLQAKAPYALKDLTAVTMLTASPLVLSVNSALPITDLPSLISYAKGNPVNFASAGVGTTPHMAGALLALRSGASLTHVPYKGSGPAMADLVAGNVQMAFSSMTAAAGFIKENRLRGIATSGTARPPLFPQLPTVAEAGVANFGVLFWTGLFVRAGTPDAIVARLNEEARKVFANPKFVAALEKSGEIPGHASVADSAAFIRAESDKWAGVIREAKITP